jgi:gluconolactonase
MAEANIYEIHDPRFRQMIVTSAGLDELYSGCRWAEGPVWFNDANQLLWSDIPNQRMLRWTPESGEHGTRRVTRTEVDGSITVLADRFHGRRLNSPNDVVVKSDGSVWFTDPTYGIMSDYEGYRAEPEQATRNVYRLDPDSGELAAAATDFNQPNGLAFSPDEKVLYVADSAASHDESLPRHIRAFDVTDGGRLANGRVFCLIDSGIPDGIRTDVDGNLWSSAADGVHCFDPAGRLIGKIRVPQAVANLTFGGPKRNRLFIAATRSVYSVYLAISGAQVP